MQRLSAQRLTAACEAAGVELGEYDLQTMRWLAGFEPQQAQVLADIVSTNRRGSDACTLGRRRVGATPVDGGRADVTGMAAPQRSGAAIRQGDVPDQAVFLKKT